MAFVSRRTVLIVSPITARARMGGALEILDRPTRCRTPVAIRAGSGESLERVPQRVLRQAVDDAAFRLRLGFQEKVYAALDGSTNGHRQSGEDLGQDQSCCTEHGCNNKVAPQYVLCESHGVRVAIV